MNSCKDLNKKLDLLKIEEASLRISSDEAYKIRKYLDKEMNKIKSQKDYDKFLKDVEADGYNADYIDSELNSSAERIHSQQKESSVAEIIKFAKDKSVF